MKNTLFLVKKIIIASVLAITGACSLMQGLDPELAAYHYRPRRASTFYSDRPSKDKEVIRSCVQGKAKSCIDVAAKMIEDENLEGAFKFFEIACNLDYGKGCFGAGNVENDKKSVVSAKDFYQKGCRYKFGPACFALAELDYKDNEVLENPKEFYKYACEMRGDYGCVRLGETYYKEGNTGLARYYFDRSCELKNELGCYNLGYLYFEDGELKKSLDSLALSCDYGHAEGCYQMARHYGYHENDNFVFKYLNEAFKYHYTNWERVEFDKHFDFLRERDSFRELIDNFLLSRRERSVNEKSAHESKNVISPEEESLL